MRWNEIARDLVAKHRMSHPVGSRAYALLSVAQYDALVATWNNKYFYDRPVPEVSSISLTPLVAVPRDPAYPSEHAAVAAASAAVLTYLFPDESAFLEGKVIVHEQSRMQAAVSFPSDIAAGDSLGREVARMVIERARTDGSDAAWTGHVPEGKGAWSSDPHEAPLSPRWGEVRPWLMTSELGAPPPPAYGSPEFNAALDEVKTFSRTRTREQARTAALWADGAGSYTPAGRWNKIAADLIVKDRLNEIRAGRAFVLLNMALMDAGIACWQTKYRYWLLRPSQADPSITTPIGLPNFPSYTSAHAVFSGAAADVLSYLFPGDRDGLETEASEAALSRIYGGIHYRFDSEAGLAQGRAVAELAINRGASDGSPPVTRRRGNYR